MKKKEKLAVCIILILSITSLSVLTTSTSASDFQMWQLVPGNEKISEVDGVLTISSLHSQNGAITPYMFREFNPKSDFEISFDMKAETLGEVIYDQAGEGFVFGFGDMNFNTQMFHSMCFWLRARAGGQFLLCWHSEACERQGLAYDWVPFVYNGLGYNNGYNYWHPNPPQNRSNAPVKPDVWYTVKLKVHENPFTTTGEVWSENGTLLGSLTVDDVDDFEFKDIRYAYMSTSAGGTFYIRNMRGLGPNSDFDFSPEVAVGVPALFSAKENETSSGSALNYTWSFGDGRTTTTQEQNVTHTYESPGNFNVTLTVTNSDGESSSTTHSIKSKMPVYLSLSTESSFSIVGSTVNVNGRLADGANLGLANEPVVLSYTFPGTASWFPISSGLTNANGEYRIQWVNPATGSFTLKAEWAGNDTHLAASNITTLNSLPYQNQYAFFVESNSTVASLAFNSTSSELSFSATGPSGTKGYLKVTISKTLLPEAQNIRIFLDGKELNYTLTETENTWILSLSYSHSTHNISVYLESEIIPDTNMPTTPATPTPSTSATEETPVKSATPTETAVPSGSPAASPTAPPANPEITGINYALLAAILLGILAVSVVVGYSLNKSRKDLSSSLSASKEKN